MNQKARFYYGMESIKMGLDMYLYERTYCPPSYKGKRKATNFTTKVRWYDGTEKKVKFKDVVYITCRKGYWRKANAIHNFFLERCSRGLDEENCNGRDLAVYPEQLKELLGICEELLKLKGKAFKKRASELLPTAEGFFWGSTGYDKWYRQDLKETVKIIKSLNMDDNLVDIIYNADW